MITESLAIISVLVVVVVMSKRAGKDLMALLVLPIICVPLSGIICYAIFDTIETASRYIAQFTLTGLAFTCILCFIFSKNLKNKNIRIGYILLSCLFSIALILAYLR